MGIGEHAYYEDMLQQACCQNKCTFRKLIGYYCWSLALGKEVAETEFKGNKNKGVTEMP